MRNQPRLGAGWMPMPPPASPRHRLGPRLRRELLIWGVLFTVALLTGVLRSPRGWLAIVIARALVGLLGNYRSDGWRHVGRALTSWAAVAALAVIVGGVSPGPPQVKAPPLKAPVKVEATQTDRLEVIRHQVIELWGRAATGFSQATTNPTRKEGR
jgi:hypothetical protein